MNGQVVSTLVQINGIYLSQLTYGDCSSSYNSVNGGGPYPDRNGDGRADTFCDDYGDIHPIGGGSTSIHIEFDHDWMAKGYCGPGRSPCDNNTITQYFSSGSIALDVQGFVYWDSDHWELHPFTAWQLSFSTGFTYSPSIPSPGAPVSFRATATGGTSPYTFNWTFGDGASATGGTPTHTYSSQGSYNATLTTKDSSGLTAKSSKVVSVRTQAFSFGAAGDFQSLTSGTGFNNLNMLQSLNPEFFLGLGDFSYDPSVTGDVWCGQFKSQYNNIEIFPGDHDTGGHASGFPETHDYRKYLNGCPVTLNVGLTCGPVAGHCYGKEYFFDYPAVNPIARFILTSPKIYNITGVCNNVTAPNGCSSQTGQPCTDQYGCWQYSQNDAHYNWVASAIDNARSSGIKWVIVGTHKLCISASDATCSMGIAFFNMLVSKKVDLIIQAHDNAYERSKQIALGLSTCSSINTDGNGYAVYNSGCVVDDGSRGYYTAGAGTVVMVQGAWTSDLYKVNDTSANGGANAKEAPYFVKLMGLNTPGAGYGFTKYKVYPNGIDVQTSLSGSFQDSFSILGTTPPLSANFSVSANPTVGSPVAFSANVSGGTTPYSYAWNFGDATTGTVNPTTHTYNAKGSYVVTLNVTDANNKVVVTSQAISVTASKLIADFTNSASPAAGNPVTFTAIASGGTAPYSYSWNFGDGSAAGTGSPVSYTYSTPANYTVALTVTDANAKTATASHGVSIKPTSLVADFTLTPASPNIGQSVSFNATVSGGTTPYSFRWDFGDGGSASGSPVSHVYSTSGSFKVTLIANDSGGQTVTLSKTVTVGRHATTTSVTCVPSSVVVNQATLCIATVTDTSGSGATSPTGTVVFAPDGFCALANPTPISASCSVSITPTVAGALTVSASYGGDSSRNTSSDSTAVTVNMRATSTSVSCSPKPVTNGTAASCSATVTDTDVGTPITPTGGVNFASNSTGLFNAPSCTLASTATVGVANCSVNYTPYVTGHHGITGAYGGDSAHSGSGGSATLAVVSQPSQAYALVVSYEGKVFPYQNGTLTQIGNFTTGLRQVAWKPDGSYALIVGNAGTLIKYDGSQFTLIPTGFAGTTVLYAVAWKSDGSYALIAGSSGLVLKYDGVSISQVSDPNFNNLYAIGWNPSGSMALLVGGSGTVLVFQNNLIQPISSGTTSPLYTVAWNPNGLYALIGGAGGAVIRYDGTSITPLNTAGVYSSSLAVRSIAWNQAGNQALLVGDYGLVLSYDGTSLAALPVLTNNFLWSVSWSGATATIVGGSGTVITYTNGTLTKQVTSNTLSLRGIAWKPL